jgi:hypothetical protein
MSRKVGNGRGAAAPSLGRKGLDAASVDEVQAIVDLAKMQRYRDTRELNRRWRRICRATTRTP